MFRPNHVVRSIPNFYIKLLQKACKEKENLEFELKIGSQGHVYLPKNIRKLLGDRMTLLPNSHAVIIYPENANPETVIKSLRIIIQDLQLKTAEKKTQT